MNYFKKLKEILKRPHEQGVLVSGDKNSMGKKLTSKRAIISIIVLFVILVGLIFIWRNNSQKPVSSPNEAVCTDQIISDSANFLENDNAAELNSISNEILSLQGFDNDANCLLIITRRYVNASDAENSRKYYEKLLTAYDQDLGYSEKFGTSARTPAELKTTIEFLEQQAKQPLPGTFFGGSQ